MTSRIREQPKKMPLVYSIPYLHSTQMILVRRGEQPLYKIDCWKGFWRLFFLVPFEKEIGLYNTYELVQQAIAERELKRT
jgi:hypothetical protein